MQEVSLIFKNEDYNAEHKVVLIPKLFDYELVKFENFNIVFDYDLNNFIVKFESKELIETELKKIALDFYTYLKIVLGYYPKIIKCSFIDLKDLPEKYKTKVNYIRNDGQYIITVDYDTFIKSFNNFRMLYDKCSLQFSVFDCSIMECSHYSDISIVNILQAFDGIFDNLTLASNAKNIVDEMTKKEIIKNALDLDKIEIIINTKEKYKNLSSKEKDEKINKLKGNFNDNLIRVNRLNFNNKLDFLFSSIKFDIFEFEKNLPLDSRYYYSNLLKLFKNTRNKIAHCSSEINDTLNGKENIGYIYKLLLVFRLLIFKEIGLEEKIDVDKLKKDIISMNSYLNDVIYEEDKNAKF